MHVPEIQEPSLAYDLSLFSVFLAYAFVPALGGEVVKIPPPFYFPSFCGCAALSPWGWCVLSPSVHFPTCFSLLTPTHQDLCLSHYPRSSLAISHVTQPHLPSPSKCPRVLL
jgi:hypothetical protein